MLKAQVDIYIGLVNTKSMPLKTWRTLILINTQLYLLAFSPVFQDRDYRRCSLELQHKTVDKTYLYWFLDVTVALDDSWECGPWRICLVTNLKASSECIAMRHQAPLLGWELGCATSLKIKSWVLTLLETQIGTMKHLLFSPLKIHFMEVWLTCKKL